MIRRIIFSLVTALVFFTACKKKDADINVPINNCTLTETHSDSLNSSYNYNADGQLSSVRSVYIGQDATLTGTNSYTYNSEGSMVTINYLSDDAYSVMQTNIYNQFNKITGYMRLTNQVSTSTVYKDSAVITYNGNTTINEVRYTYQNDVPSDTLDYIYTLDDDGDIVQVMYRPFQNSLYNGSTFTFDRDTLVTFCTYEYYPDKMAVPIEGVNFGILTLKKVKFTKKGTFYFHSIDGLNQFTEDLVFGNYTYQYLPDGRLDKWTVTTNMPDFYVGEGTHTCVYSCN